MVKLNVLKLLDKAWKSGLVGGILFLSITSYWWAKQSKKDIPSVTVEKMDSKETVKDLSQVVTTKDKSGKVTTKIMKNITTIKRNIETIPTITLIKPHYKLGITLLKCLDNLKETKYEITAGMRLFEFPLWVDTQYQLDEKKFGLGLSIEF